MKSNLDSSVAGAVRRLQRLGQRVRTLRLLAVAILISLLPAASAASFTTAINGNWFNTNTWVGLSVPGNGAEVTIRNGVNLVFTNGAESITLTKLDVIPGTDPQRNIGVSGPAALFVSGTGNVWRDCQRVAPITFLPGSTLTITGACIVSYMTNFGAVTVAANSDLTLVGAANTIIDVLPGAVWDWAGDGEMRMNVAFESWFLNRGLFRKSGGAGALRMNNTLFASDQGTIQVDSGSLVWEFTGNFTNSAFQVAAGAAMVITNGAILVGHGSLTGSGAGKMEVDAGILRGESNVVLNFPAGMLQLKRGQIGNSQGTLVNQGHASMTTTSAGVSELNFLGIFENEGVFLHTTTNKLTIGSDVFPFKNRPGGIYRFLADGEIRGFAARFLNDGLIHKSAGSGEARISTGLSSGQGTIQVDTGKLVLSGGGQWTGMVFNASSGASVVSTGSTVTLFGPLTGSGSGRLELNGAQWSAFGPSSFNFQPGFFHWLTGTLNGTSVPLTNLGTIQFAATNSGTLNGPLFNTGTFLHTRKGSFNIATGDGRFVNRPGATFDLQDDGTVTGTGFSNDGVVHNAGTLRKSGGAGVSAFSSRITVTNLSSVICQTGTMHFAGKFTQTGGSLQLAGGALSSASALGFELNGGALSGSGNVTGRVANAGATVRPGNSAGAINITGDYFQDTGGNLEIEIAGRNAGQFDQLIVSGNATLGGTLTVAALNGFSAQPGDQFQILACSTRGNTFANVSLPPGLTVSYANNGVFLVASGGGGPTLAVSDASVVEGNSGVTNIVFQVTLSAPVSSNVNVNFATQDGTAHAGGGDYFNTSGNTFILAGQTNAQIAIGVPGDTNFEPNETFFLNVIDAPGVTIADGQAVGTILNDDAAPPPAPDVVFAGYAVAAESCSPTNGAVDPGETVTVNLTLQNVGTADTTNLIVTLLAGSGVVSPSSPQNYGALVLGGAAVARPFTFTVQGFCGSHAELVLRLQDGSAPPSFLTNGIRLGKPVVIFSENFDTATPPNLPAGWVASHSGAGAAPVTSAAQSDSAPNALFFGDPADVSDNSVTTPPILISTLPAQLQFRQRMNSDGPFDGGVLEISITNGPFMDILAAGGFFESGGYTTTLGSGTALTGRQGWSSDSQGFLTTSVFLPFSAFGQDIRLRWRFASDDIVGAPGWFVDSIVVTAGIECCRDIVQPVLANPRIVGGQFAFDFATVSGQSYIVEVTPALTEPPIWDEHDFIIGNGSVMTVTVPIAANGAAFFRVVVP